MPCPTAFGFDAGHARPVGGEHPPADSSEPTGSADLNGASCLDSPRERWCKVPKRYRKPVAERESQL